MLSTNQPFAEIPWSHEYDYICMPNQEHYLLNPGLLKCQPLLRNCAAASDNCPSCSSRNGGRGPPLSRPLQNRPPPTPDVPYGTGECSPSAAALTTMTTGFQLCNLPTRFRNWHGGHKWRVECTKSSLFVQIINFGPNSTTLRSTAIIPSDT